MNSFNIDINNLYQIFRHDLTISCGLNLSNQLQKYKLYNNTNFDIEFAGGWTTIKIFDMLGEDKIDEVSRHDFDNFIRNCQRLSYLIRVQLHIIEPFSEVIEHVDDEAGYDTSDVEVINYVRSLDTYDNFLLTVADNTVILKIDSEFVFDGQQRHSAKNNSGQYIGLIVFHIDKEFYEKN